MECAPSTGSSRDILSSQRQTFLLYWLPGIAIAVTAQPAFSVGLRTVVWTASLTTMGITCLVNAVRCHRVHCYATGPFFLVMAVASLLLGLGVVSLGRNGWSFLGLTILVGCAALYYLPELYLGKYRKGSGTDAAHT